MELSKHEPHLGERELVVRDDLQSFLVHLLTAVEVFSGQFFVQRESDPQKDVPFPKPFLLDRGQIGDSTLEYCACLFHVCGPFLQPDVVEPDIVVARVLFELLFILESPFGKNDVFHTCAVAMFLLEAGVHLVQLLSLVLGHVVQRIFVDGPGTLVLFHPLFEGREVDEQCRVVCVLPELGHCPFQHPSSLLCSTVLLLELGIFDIGGNFWMAD
mmetsp:Transcript_9980/g.14528  ORF Transcript_9980/g.14528 Transcript_9980/m.14528 type:complete len:214 (-) Transcript_9980:7-648(-)